MKTKTIGIIAVIIVVLGAGYALARPGSSLWNNMMGGYGFSGMMGYGGNGNGMMGYGGNGNGMMGYGGNENGMMGYGGNGNGMMGNGGNTGGYGSCAGYTGAGDGTNATPITIDKAKESAEKYIAATGNTDLILTEVIQFDNHFYAGVKEKSTGRHAFELIINKYTGAVYPEMGPNMMWNTKYGHMNNGETTVTEEQAVELAQKYLDTAIPGTRVADADTFYGYYTMEVLKDGTIYGMLSVNGNTGAVWYHNWHGTFEQILKSD